MLAGAPSPLDGRSEPALLALAALAVLDTPAQLDALAQVAELSVEGCDVALRELEAAGMVEVEPAGYLGRLVAAGRAACDRLAPGHLQRMHRLAAEQVSASARLWHQAMGGEPVYPGDLAAVVDWLLERNRSRRALDLLEAQAPSGPLLRARARVELARGEGETAVATLRGAWAAFEDEDALVDLARLLNRRGAAEEALSLVASEPGIPARVAYAWALVWNSRPEEVEAVAASLSGAPQAWVARVAAAWLLGEHGRAETLAREALEAVPATELAARADLSRNLGMALYYRGERAEAARVLEEVVAQNRQLGRVPELARSLNNLAIARYGLGQWSQAAGLFDEFRMLCARLGDAIEGANATNNTALLLTLTGERERAIRLFEQCIAAAKVAGYERIVPVAVGNKGEALFRLGRHDEAAAAYAEAVEGLRALDAHHDLVEVQRRQLELKLAHGALDETRAGIAELLADPRVVEVQTEAAHLWRLSAACSLAEGQAARAEGEALEAIARFEAQGARFELALARIELARARRALGRQSEAQHEGAAALDILRPLGARQEIHRAQALLDHIRASARESERDARRGHLLLDVARQFGTTQSLERLLPLVLDRVVQLLRAERGLFALLDEAGGIDHVVLHNLQWEGAEHPLPISQSLMREVIEDARPVAVQDALAEAERLSESVLTHGLRSMVAVPVIAEGGEVTGVLYVDSRAEVSEDLVEEIDLLTALAHLVSTAVENTRLLEERTRRAQLLAALVHDLRTPLMVISVNGSMLLDADLEPEEVPELGEEIVKSSKRVLRMIDDMLRLARAESAVEAPTLLHLDEVFPGHISGLIGVARSLGLELALEVPPELPPVETMPERLPVILDNLVFNALKHARRGSEVSVSLSLQDQRAEPEVLRRRLDGGNWLFREQPTLRPAPESRFVRVDIHNTGRSIRPELIGSLFQMFRRGERESRGIHSSGLGLAIVDQCVRQLGGCVWVVSDEEAGTTFSFTLPTSVLLG